MTSLIYYCYNKDTWKNRSSEQKKTKETGKLSAETIDVVFLLKKENWVSKKQINKCILRYVIIEKLASVFNLGGPKLLMLFTAML